MNKRFYSFTLISVLIILGLIVMDHFSKNYSLEPLQSMESPEQLLSWIHDHNSPPASREPIATDVVHGDQPVTSPAMDRMDLVKTDGERIYQIRNGQLLISQIEPVEQAGFIQAIPLESKMQMTGLYLDDDYVYVLGQHYPYFDHQSQEAIPSESVVLSIYNKQDLTKKKHYRFEGLLVASQFIDQKLMVVVQKYIPFQDPMLTEHQVLPHYSIAGEMTQIGHRDIYYHPDIVPRTMTTIFSLDVTTLTLEHFTHIGDVQHVYMNEESLYLTHTTYPFRILPDKELDVATEETIVTKISHHDGMKSIRSVKVKGLVQSPDMMDESKGYFRIITTSGWDEQGANHLTIFDDEMKLVGTIKSFAPGERAYFTRFVDNRVYVVTNRAKDPLYVFDLFNPYKPRVLSQMKTQDYITYLQPIDDDHLISLGYRVSDEGITTGFKLALYDVGNPRRLKERWNHVFDFTDEPYIQMHGLNQQALLYDFNKQLVAFPLTRIAYTEDNHYQRLTHVAEYRVYSIQRDLVLIPVATIHHTDEDDQPVSIVRGLMLNDYMYTVSNHCIQIHDTNNFDHVATIYLPK